MYNAQISKGAHWNDIIPFPNAATLGLRESPDFGGEKNATSQCKVLVSHCLVSAYFPLGSLNTLCVTLCKCWGTRWTYVSGSDLHHFTSMPSPWHKDLPCSLWDFALAQEYLEENANSWFLLCPWGNGQWLCLYSSNPGEWPCTIRGSLPRDSIKALATTVQLSFLIFPRVLLPSGLISIRVGSK